MQPKVNIVRQYAKLEQHTYVIKCVIDHYSILVIYYKRMVNILRKCCIEEL